MNNSLYIIVGLATLIFSSDQEQYYAFPEYDGRRLGVAVSPDDNGSISLFNHLTGRPVAWSSLTETELTCIAQHLALKHDLNSLAIKN